MIPELAKLLEKSIQQSLEDRVAVSFSGGVDSSLVAHVAGKICDVELFSCGTANSEDILYAEQVARLLNLKLYKLIFEEQEILDIYNKCYNTVPNDLLKVELLVPVYKAAEEARKRDHRVLLFGSASEELFVGYERYYTYASEGKDLDGILREEFSTLRSREISWVKKICYKLGVEARFPFYNQELANFVFDVPLELRMEDHELKKGILREAAKMLGLTDLAVKRKKRAMQYGSGVHKILLKHADELNKVDTTPPWQKS
ncbi:MAG: asparagine synthase C-terminal domain-containing protein [Candidatus Micrarchaeota archaeon]|nr:asparagine synthase C-terminal domain-containing protein [Candidatus Micrarchaeota archaeon]